MPQNPHAEHLQELLEGLNEPQREAVTHGEGPLLILAGAGSGKTRVLAHRIAFLIYTDQAQAGELLAITFTNKAAAEMRGRVEQLLGSGTRGMWLMTFHAACARILRAEAERLGYTRQFTIYDQADARRLTKRSADAVGVDPKRFTPAAIHTQISAAKNRLRAPADVRQAIGSPFEEMVADVYEIYERDLLPDERDGLRRPAVRDRQPAGAVPKRSARATPRRSATCSSTSTRTPTTRSIDCFSCSSGAVARSPRAGGARAWRDTATSRSSETTASRSTAFEAPRCATSLTSRRTSPTRE